MAYSIFTHCAAIMVAGMVNRGEYKEAWKIYQVLIGMDTVFKTQLDTTILDFIHREC